MDEREFGLAGRKPQPARHPVTVLASRPVAGPAPQVKLDQLDPVLDERPFRGGERVALVLCAAFVGKALVAAVASLPSSSLGTALDGSAIHADASLAGAAGLALLLAGAVCAWGWRDGETPAAMGAVVAFSLVAALLSGLMLAAAAETMASSPVHDGVARDADAPSVAATLFSVSSCVAAFMFSRRRPRADALRAVGASLGMGAGGAALAAAMWTSANAESLTAAAEARPHTVSVPFPPALIVIAAIVIVALWRRPR